MISDEILEELEAFREAYAAQFGYDIEKMLADVRDFGRRNPVAPICLYKKCRR